MDKISTGKIGENLACNFLLANGYKIIFKNFIVRNSSEIDIIAAKDNILSFIEVKTRHGFAVEEKYKAVNQFKILKIRRGVSKFLALNPKYYNYQLRLYVAIVLINPHNQSYKVVFYDYID